MMTGPEDHSTTTVNPCESSQYSPQLFVAEAAVDDEQMDQDSGLEDGEIVDN